jgi:hypothetical protein
VGVGGRRGRFDYRCRGFPTGVELAYRTFDKVRQVDQGAIADSKHLGAVLAMISDEQLRRGPSGAAGRAGAISATPVSSRSAELLSTSQAG